MQTYDTQGLVCAGLLPDHCNVCFKCVLLYFAAVPLTNNVCWWPFCCCLETATQVLPFMVTYGKAPLDGVQHWDDAGIKYRNSHANLCNLNIATARWDWPASLWSKWFLHAFSKEVEPELLANAPAWLFWDVDLKVRYRIHKSTTVWQPRTGWQCLRLLGLEMTHHCLLCTPGC